LIASDEITPAASAASLGAAIDAGLKIDGIVCRDDLAAMGALRALHERGIRIPDDIAIVGWDNISFTATTFPSITSIAPDLDSLARVALEMLGERIAGFDGLGRHRLVDYELVVRESAPPA